MQLCLSFLLLVTNFASVRSEFDSDEILMANAWGEFIRNAAPDVNYFEVRAGDALLLNCSDLEHVHLSYTRGKTYHWSFGSRPLMDEGDFGHVQIDETGSTITIDNVNEVDSGVYTCHCEPKFFMTPLQVALRQEVVIPSNGYLPVGVFVVKVIPSFKFSLEIGDTFEFNASDLLKPFSDSVKLLQLHIEDWVVLWKKNQINYKECTLEEDCNLKLDSSSEDVVGTWALYIASSRYSDGAILMKRELRKFSIKQFDRPDYINSFSVETHQYYIVCVSMTIAFGLLTLHLFTNLCWVPFVFDCLPKEVSEPAVIAKSGVQLEKVVINDNNLLKTID